MGSTSRLGRPHHGRVVPGALAFDKRVEASLVQDRIQSRVERMPGRRRQIRRRDPQGRLLGFAGTHRHIASVLQLIGRVDPSKTLSNAY